MKKTTDIVPNPRHAPKVFQSDREGKVCQTTRSDRHRTRRLHGRGEALYKWRTWKNRGELLHDDHMIKLQVKVRIPVRFCKPKARAAHKIITCVANLVSMTSMSITQR